MASQMLTKFNKYWNVIHGIMGVATVLDPRYKMKLIEFYYPQIFGVEFDYEVRRIKQLCDDLILEYQLKINMNDTAGESSGPTLDAIDGDSQDALNAYDRFIMNEKMSNSMRLKSELERYLEEDVLPRTSSFDILLWWKISGVKFPLLQAIAKDILSIPVSTVASESAFSTGGRLVNSHRSRLHPNTLEALMCAQDWIWAKENQS